MADLMFQALLQFRTEVEYQLAADHDLDALLEAGVKRARQR